MPSGQPRPRVVIAGGSGFLGLSLADHLARAGWEVVILSRSAPQTRAARHVAWDGRTLGAWALEIDGAAAVVNLAGRSVDCRKTAQHAREILESRVMSTRALGQAVTAAARRPAVWVQMSTAHIYGDPEGVICDESTPTGVGLAPDVGRVWEAALDEGCPAGVRRVITRLSFVLGRRGPAGASALGRLAPLARWGLGGTVGSGRQGISWIHQDDFNRFYELALRDASISGVFNLTAPGPISNREFMRHLRRAVGGLGRFIGLPAPAPLVRLGSRFVLNTDPELALLGRFVISRRLEGAGFSFRFPEAGAALRDLFEAPKA